MDRAITSALDAPRQALTLCRDVLSDTARVLRASWVPILTLSLIAFVIHGLLIELAAHVAYRNGPGGVAILISAIAIRLTALAMCLWLAARVLRIGDRSLPVVVAELNQNLAEDLEAEAAADDAPHEFEGHEPVQRISDAVRLAIAPMVIVYAAWNLVNWDIHAFAETKFRLSQSSAVAEGSRDLSNISFADGGWMTYIPWAIGLFIVKVILEEIHRRTDWRVLDLGIVFCECGWVIMGWLVFGRTLFELQGWLARREVARWFHDLGVLLADIDLPFDLSLPAILVAAWTGLMGLLGVLLTRVMWPLVWIALVGVVVGWLSVDEDVQTGRDSGRRSIRALNKVMNTSTRGIREKWQPLWRTFTAVLRTGVVPMLTMAALYAVLMYLAAFVRELVTLTVPYAVQIGPESSDVILRLTDALIQPIRLALLVSFFAVVVRAWLSAREPRQAPRGANALR